jgi:hypothetical protein
MSDQQGTNQPDPSQQNSEPTPPTSAPSNEVPAWAQQLMEQNRQLQQNNNFLAQQVQQFQQQFQQQQHQQQTPIDPNDFHTNPVDTISRIVQQQLQPVQQFTVQMARQQAIQQACEFYAAQDSDFPQFKQQFIGLLSNAEVNAQTAQAAYYAARGWFSTQPKTTPAPAAAPAGQPKGPDLSTIPAHLRPSGVAPSSQTSTVKLRPLSEQEEIVRKTSRLSHAEYLYHNGEITKEQLLATQGKK